MVSLKAKLQIHMKNLPGIMLCFIIVMLIIIADVDNTMSGDEVIAYGMANSYYKGWMLSNGRVGDYLKNRIIDNDINTTLDNLFKAGKDVLENRSQAEYFSYPRPKESGWYTQSEHQSRKAVYGGFCKNFRIDLDDMG